MAEPVGLLRTLIERLTAALDVVDRNLIYPKGQKPLGWQDLARSVAELEAALATPPQQGDPVKAQALLKEWIAEDAALPPTPPQALNARIEHYISTTPRDERAWFQIGDVRDLVRRVLTEAASPPAQEQELEQLRAERDQLLAEMRAKPENYPNLLRINREYASRCEAENAELRAKLAASPPAQEQD